MDLTGYVDELGHQLAVAAAAGGDEARLLAERLTAPLEAATRLVLLDALTAAAGEITRDLAPGSVDVRLRGRDPEFVVTLPPPDLAPDLAPAGAMARSTAPAGIAPGERSTDADPEADEGATARITLRLPDQLKGRIEQAAGLDGVSVNSWLVRALGAAVEPLDARRAASARLPTGGQSYTGWAR